VLHLVYIGYSIQEEQHRREENHSIWTRRIMREELLEIDEVTPQRNEG
jgi:hypothetical protein